MAKKSTRKLYQPPHWKLERFALLFFSIAVVFAALSFVPPYQSAYQQSASATAGFASIFSASVYELGSQSAAVAINELNVGAAWDALTSAEANAMYPGAH